MKNVSKKENYDILIIGAGISGTFIARELSKYRLKIAIIEKYNDVANGTTKANSAIIHAGYDAKPGSLMAELNVYGNEVMGEVCEELDVPFKRIGSLVVGHNKDDEHTLKELYQYGIENKVPDIKIINKDELLELEPAISPNVTAALYAPSCGIVGPWELAIALAENSIDNGVELFLNNKVESIETEAEGFTVMTNQNSFDTKYIINAAGVYADEIYKMVNDSGFTITPRRGEYFLLDKSAGTLVNHVIFQTPGKMGKGVLVAPTVHGNIIVGPNSENISNKEGIETSALGLQKVRSEASKNVMNIPFNATIRSFSGLRAEPDTGDFIIEESENIKGFINVAGIKSPGLSAAPAIAIRVVGIVKQIMGDLSVKKSFSPRRRKTINLNSLSSEEKNKVIKDNPSYGSIVCRCENISEGEIVDSIHRNAGARTLDGVKKRVRPGMGRCQGGFCSPKVMEILARELDQSIKEIVLDAPDSKILFGSTKKEIIRATSVKDKKRVMSSVEV